MKLTKRNETVKRISKISLDTTLLILMFVEITQLDQYIGAVAATLFLGYIMHEFINKIIDWKDKAELYDSIENTIKRVEKELDFAFQLDKNKKI